MSYIFDLLLELKRMYFFANHLHYKNVICFHKQNQEATLSELQCYMSFIYLTWKEEDEDPKAGIRNQEG